jgi:hypothetical protein
MSTTTTAAQGGVHESLLDFLLMEAVSSIAQDNDLSKTYEKMEEIGYKTGFALVERLLLAAKTSGSTSVPTRFPEALDVMKFICKDFWIAAFRKQIDNLKTNHKGIYVLTDNVFRPLLHCSLSSSSLTSPETIAAVSNHLAFPCGLIRGALANLGLVASVQAESTGLPTCTFSIKLVTPAAR